MRFFGSRSLVVASFLVAGGNVSPSAWAYEPREFQAATMATPQLQVSMTRIPLVPAVESSSEESGDPRGGGCPQQFRTYTDPALFQGGAYRLQGGFVETEIAAVSYQLAAADFPFRLDMMEFVLGTKGATVTTTTQYTVIVWEGQPNNGTVIFQELTDDLILPPAVIGPGDAAVNLQVSVDPNDPEQIIVQDNGSHKFSIGIRVDEHHNPPVDMPGTNDDCSFCLFIGGPPPCPFPFPECTSTYECCPPSPQSNAFPAADDNGGVANPSNNWIWARACVDAECAAASGWRTFQGSGGPGGDWVMRATYTPVFCEDSGACCFGDGNCQIRTEADCIPEGVWQGDNTDCSPTPCPQPVGACCRADGFCDDDGLAIGCNDPDEVFHLAQECPDVVCPEPKGACCTPADGCEFVEEAICETQFGGAWLGALTSCGESSCMGACCINSSGCDLLSETDCGVVPNSQFQGVGTACEPNNECPVGACCLPTGACTSGTLSFCQDQDGEFQGHESNCGQTSCPQPTGACCFSTGSCLPNRTFNNCTNVLQGTWAGAGTTCPCTPACTGADGDVDENLVVDGRDVPVFVSAMLSGPTPAQRCHGDFDGSGSLGEDDIPEMVDALLNVP